MLRTGDPAPDAEGRSVAIDTSDARAMRLPDDFPLFNAEFARAGADLVATKPDGGQVILRGFFAVADPPELLSPGGARISGELVAGLARPEAPVQLWEALFGPGPAPVGIVDSVNGSLGVARADGTRVELGTGVALFSGDIIETGPDATAGITLADAVLLGIGPASRLVVISSDPGAETPINLAVEQGEYAIACGPSPRPLVVDGPAGRIEADGAQLVLTYRADGSLEVILLPDEDGSVGGLVFTNGTGTVSLEWPYQWLTANGDDALPQTHGVLSVDEIVAGYGQVLHGLPAGCAAALPLVAANAAADDADDLSAAALEALVEFETGAGGDDPGDAPAPTERIVVTQADPLAGGSESFAATAPQAPATTSQGQAETGTGATFNGPNTTNEQILQSLAVQQQAPPRPTFPEPPPTADPPIAVRMAVSGWDIGDWMTLVPQYPSHRGREELYLNDVERYDEPEPFVSTPLPGQAVRTFAPSDGATMVLMAAGPLGSPLETGRGVEIYHIEDDGNPGHLDRLGLPTGTLANEIAGANPIDGAVMWATRTIAAGTTITTIRFDWMFDGRDEPSFDDFAAFTVAGTVAGVDETSVYELARNADVGGFGASGWRTSEWTFEPANGSETTLKLGFVVMNDGDDANEPRLLIDNLRIDTPIEAEVQPLGDPQSRTLGTLVTYGPVPTAFDDAVTTNEDAVLTIAAGTLLANDHSPTGVQSLSVTAVTANAATVGGVTLGSGGVITYDPGNHFDGLAFGATAADTFGYTITDINDATATATVTVTIIGINDAPVAADDEFTTDEDTAIVIAPAGNDTDPEGDTLSITAIDGIAENVGREIVLASGALLTVAADGTFAYDPNGRFDALKLDQPGNDSFAYTIDDGHGGVDTATVKLTITGVNDAPVAADDEFTTDEDTAIVIAPAGNDTDPEGDTLSITAIIKTATTGVVTLNPDSTVGYDPRGRFDSLAQGQQATDSFAYTLDDGAGGTATATVTVTVTGVNDTPTAVDDTLSTDEDSPIIVDGNALLANDTDPDGRDTLTVTAVDGAATVGTVTLDDDGTITYDPGGRFDSLAAGANETDTFTYTISDGHGGTDTATVKLTITGINDAPEAADDRFPTSEDEIVGGNVLEGHGLADDEGKDSDVDGDSLRVAEVNGSAAAVGTQVRLVSGALLIVHSDGNFEYAPDGQFEGLSHEELRSTPDSFAYTVDDGHGGTDTATVTIPITGVNDAPTAQTLTYSGVRDLGPVQSFAFAGDDVDDDAATLTFTVVGQPAEGSVTIVGDGTFSFDPGSDFADLGEGEVREVSFDYRAVDRHDATSAPATVTIIVEGVNDAPVAIDVAYWTDKISVLDVAVARSVLLNDRDVDDADNLAVAAVNGVEADVGAAITLPSGALLTLNADGTFTYDPNGRFDGLDPQQTATDSFDYTVTDGDGLTDTASVTVEINGFKQILAGGFESDLDAWNSAGSFDTRAGYDEPDGAGNRFAATDGPMLAVLEAVGSSASEIEAGLALPTGALPGDDGDASGPNAGAAIWTTQTVKTGDEIRFDWNFDANDQGQFNDTAVFTVSDGIVAQVFKLSDVRTTDDFGASGWQSFVYDPTGDFGVGNDGRSLTIGFAVVNDQNDRNPSHLLVDNVRVKWTLPAPVDDSLTVAEDSRLGADPERNLLANDRDSAETGGLRISAVNRSQTDDGTGNVGSAITLASGATLTVHPDGTYDLDPTVSAEIQALGVDGSLLDQFTYAIEDANDRESLGTATVFLKFEGVNDAPDAADDIAVTDALSPVLIDVDRLLVNDEDPDSDVLTVTAVDGSGTAGTVALTDDGTIVYDPNGRFTGLAAGETAIDTFTYTIDDGHGGTDTATVTVTIQGRDESPDAPGALVASFEEPAPGQWLFGWDRIKPLASEPVSIVSGYSETDGAMGNFLPTNGGRMVVLEAFGSDKDPVTPVAQFLGVPAALLPTDTDSSTPKDGSAMKTTIRVESGDEISFDWMFDGRDQRGDENQAFNDFAVLTVAGATGSQVFKLADVRTTGDFGASGWRTSKYLATADGTLTIGFAVMNDEISHGLGDVRNSRLLVDNVRVNRELGDGFQLLDGEPGDAFQTWVQAPTAGNDTVVTTEDAAVTLAPADLLVNDLPPAVGGTIEIVNVDADLEGGTVKRDADGTITYNPLGGFEHLGEGETATESFLYTIAASNGGTAVARVDITITGVNDAPVASDDAFSTNEDTGLAGNVLADNGAGSDDDAEGDTLTVTRVNGLAANVGSQIALASGALLTVNADGTFAYDPNGRFDALKPGQPGNDSFAYTIDDGHGGVDTATVKLTITGVNDAPVAADDEFTTDEDTAIVIAPAGNDTDPEGDTLSVTAINKTATTGEVTLNPGGTVDYDPRGRFDSLAQGQQATDNFAYTLDDGAGGIASGTVTVTVTGLNDVPMATLSAAATDEDGTVTMDVLAGASDPDVGDTLSVSALDGSATTGAVTLNPDGTITYDPDGRFDALTDGETAVDTFAYTVSDDHGGTATQTVTVTINGIGGGPSTPGTLLQSFETPLDANDTRGLVLIANLYNEPDGNQDQYLPTDGTGMAFLEASGAFPSQIESFLGLAEPFADDTGDNSSPSDGAALRVTVDVRAGDEVSFDWMFDANDIVMPPMDDLPTSGFNDFSVFAAEGQSFTLSDVRQTFNETGMQVRASGWRTSVYTAQSDGPLTIGFAVVNDDNSSYDSHLLLDNVRLNREFGDGYQVVDTQAGGIFETVVQV